MPTFDRYLRRNLLTGFLLVLLLLIAVFSFLDFVEELDETGQGGYQPANAFTFVLLTTPARTLALIPVTALLGSLLGLGALDQSNELTAMRAAGVSARRIGWSAMKTGVLLMLAVAILAEFAVPSLAQRAWKERTLAISGSHMLRTESGDSFWFRDGRRFISVRDMMFGQIPTDIDIYEFNQAGELEALIHAQEARLQAGGDWLLKGVDEKRFEPGRVTGGHHPNLVWKAFLTPRKGAVTELDAESLSPSDLYQYARDLRERGQDADRYELALWRKLNLPFATGAMILLSIPLVFGTLRLSSTGKRVMFGAGVGVAFYLGDQIIAQAGLLLSLDPVLTATVPVAVLGCAAAIMLRQVR
jgi:lipopolysaccharide export system permease protein